MHVLLVHPPFRDRLAVMPPLGLGYIATALQTAGHSAAIMDCNMLEAGPEELLRKVEEEQPGLIGITLKSKNILDAFALVRAVKERFPDLPFVLGGAHFSGIPEETLRCLPEADYGIVGEGEPALPLLATALEQGDRAPDAIPGLVRRDGDGFLSNGRALVADLDAGGLPAWDLLRPGSYPPAPTVVFARAFPTAPILLTRGCQHACRFCAGKAVYGSAFRVRSPELAVEEVRLLVEDHGIREIQVVDDNCLQDREHIQAFCRALLEADIRIPWTVPNGSRIDGIDRETTELLRAAGCYRISVGVDSGSPRILQLMGKSLDQDWLRERIEILHEGGIEVLGHFILGYPGETTEDLQSTLRLALDLPLAGAGFSAFAPLPGSPIGDELLAAGKISLEEFQHTSFYIPHRSYADGISRADLVRFIRKAYLRFYLRPRVAFALSREIASLQHLGRILHRIGFMLRGLRQATMRVLLVHPRFRDRFTVQPPLGLGYLAKALQRSPHSVDLLDCNLLSIGAPELVARIEELQPGLIGFTVRSKEILDTFGLIAAVKERFPEIPVVLGGPHVSAMPRETLERLTAVEFGVVGEGETGLPILASALEGGGEGLDRVPGLVWRDGDTIRGGELALTEDLDDLGAPAWDLLRPEIYPHAPTVGFVRAFPVAPVLMTRGCAYQCRYCAAKKVYGSHFRVRSPESVVEEVQLLAARHGIREFQFTDDNPLQDQENMRRFCRLYLESGLRLPWTLPNGSRFDRLERETVRLLREAGCYRISVGIESGSQRVQELMGKRLDLDLLRQQVELVHGEGIEVMAHFLVGYPGETWEDALKTLRISRSLPLSAAGFSAYIPLPGSEEGDRLFREGKVSMEELQEASFYVPHGSYGSGLTRDQIARLLRRAWLGFYLRPRIVRTLALEVASLRHLGWLCRRSLFLLRSLTRPPDRS